MLTYRIMKRVMRLWKSTGRNSRHLYGLVFATLALSIGASSAAPSIEELQKLARKRDNYEEQFLLGMHYFNGDVPKKDAGDALVQFKKAAKSLSKAQHMVGLCYALGAGVKRNDKEAFGWFQKAADAGDDTATFKVAVCYEKGLGVDKSPSAALRWYKRLSDKGIMEAQYKVGLAHYRGMGTAIDYSAAAKLFLQAAEQGHQASQLTLGGCYRAGQGVPRDFVQAYKWLGLAAELGNATAQERLDSLIKYGMKKIQVDQAKKLIAEFKTVSK